MCFQVFNEVVDVVDFGVGVCYVGYDGDFIFLVNFVNYCLSGKFVGFFVVG